MRGITALAFGTVCLALALGQDAEGPVVSTELGQVRGGMMTSRGGKMYYSFKGIPFGKVKERFQEAELADKWDDVKDATQPGNACLQVTKEGVEGEEDCLNLNVYSKKLPKEGEDKMLYPVVVYLHPGLHIKSRNNDYDPKYFLDEDVVVVIPNYRLNVFGFLNTGDKNAPGNAGLRDQILALKWVQQNIEKFGGDKGRVTLLGSGTGAADAFLHTTSPQSKGLIHNVVAMDGAALSRTSLVIDPSKQAKKLGGQVGCPVDSSEALVKCLKEKPAKEILEKKTKLNMKEFNVEDVAWFAPTIDKPLEGQTEADLVIPDNPGKLLKEGKIINKVPVILGANDHQGVNGFTTDFLLEPAMFDKLDKQWAELAPLLLVYYDTATDKDVVSAKIREFYLGNKTFSPETFEELTNIFMDRHMGYGLVYQAKLYSKAAPVYLYLFKHTPETTKLKFLGIDKNLGMAHLDDVQYLFRSNNPKYPYPELTMEQSASEYELSTGLVKALSSFAENGKPTKVWGEGKEWKKIDSADEMTKWKWFVVGKETSFTQLPDSLTRRIGIWNDLYSKELAKEKETPTPDPF